MKQGIHSIASAIVVILIVLDVGIKLALSYGILSTLTIKHNFNDILSDKCDVTGTFNIFSYIAHILQKPDVLYKF